MYMDLLIIIYWIPLSKRKRPVIPFLILGRGEKFVLRGQWLKLADISSWKEIYIINYRQTFSLQTKTSLFLTVKEPLVFLEQEITSILESCQ